MEQFDLEKNPNELTKSNTSELDNDASAHSTHGVVYSHNRDTNGYTVEHYSVDGIDHSYDLATETRLKKKAVPNKTFSASTKKTRIVAIVLLMCVFLSITGGIGAFYLVSFLASDSMLPPGKEIAPGTSSPENNITFVDKTPPLEIDTDYTPGQLMSMEDAIECVKDSVVEITTETVKNGLGGYSQYVVSGAGSGVIISTGGYIVTNNHVIDGASNIIVRLTDGSEYEAVLIGKDSKTDVAVISITPDDGVSLTSAIIGSAQNLRLGQTVIAIGNPLGQLGGTVTDGIISSLARDVDFEGNGSMTLLQTNAAVSPGNSGGGLFDLYGRLVGIVNAKTSGQGVEGISFAIPIDTAWDIANQLISKGYVAGRPSLGLDLKQVQYSAGIFGDVVAQVVVAHDIDQYGLKENDIIISINGYEIYYMSDVDASISSNEVGDVVTIRIKRDRKYYELKLKLVEYVPDGESADDPTV